MADAEQSNDGNDGASQVDEMTVARLKEELKRRKLRVTGNKADLVTRLKAALVLEDQHEEGSDDDETDDESKDERDEAGTNGGEEHKGWNRPKFVPTFKDVEESIDMFSGDDGKDVNAWIKEFEDLAKLCEWDMIQKTIYAKRLLRGSARLFAKTDDCGKTWRTMKTTLRTEFAQRVDSRAVHKELQRRKKKTDESYHEYCYKTMEIAARADVETKAVIQYIIDGIEDEGYKKAVLYGAKTIRELKDKFDIYKEMCGRVKSDTKTSENKKKFINTESKDAKRDGKRCYNCGDSNHLGAVCPTKRQGTKCFACNKYGHIAAKCPESVSVEKKNTCNVVQADNEKRRKNVVINGVKLNAVIDTGSDLSLIGKREYERIGSPILGNRKIQFRGAGSEKNTTLGDVRVKICIDMEIYYIVIHVVSDGTIPCGILIGTDFLNDVDVRVRKGIVTISKIVNDPVEVPEVYKIDVISDAMQGDKNIDLSHVKDERIKEEVECLIKEYKPEKVKDVGIKMSIVVKDDVPVTLNARRLSVEEKNFVNSQVRVWLKEGVIQPSCSDYASPIMLVGKKNGTTRMCVDYRRLNEKIVKNRYPLPLIEDQLDLLQGAKVYSTLDLENGFFHVSVE